MWFAIWNLPQNGIAKKYSLISMLTLRMKQITGMDHEAVTKKIKKKQQMQQTFHKKLSFSGFPLHFMKKRTERIVVKSKRRGEKSC